MTPTRLDPAQSAEDREEPTRLNISGASARFFYGKEIGVEDHALPFIVLGLPVPPRDQPVQIAKIYHHLHLRETAMIRRHQEEIATLNARMLTLEKRLTGESP